MGDYDLGDQVVLTAVFRDQATGELFDPDTVLVRLMKPDGNTDDTAVVTKESTGSYQSIVAPDQIGTWSYRWFTTGATLVAEECNFYVRPQKVPST